MVPGVVRLPTPIVCVSLTLVQYTAWFKYFQQEKSNLFADVWLNAHSVPQDCQAA